MFGREPTSLSDGRNISVDIFKDDYDEYIKHHLDKIDRTRKLVINNTIKIQERIKINYDKEHMERSYEPRELVAVWTPIRKIGKCEKLLRKYFGPYRILKMMSSVNYMIEPKDNPGQDPLIVHVSRLKPYYERMNEIYWLDKGGQTGDGHKDLQAMGAVICIFRDWHHCRVKAKTSLQDNDVSIDDTTTKLFFTPQEKEHQSTRDKVPKLRRNPWQDTSDPYQ
ncbi:K02A2.6-like [Cordylochernes scorpioides]|uniref:K02A2.6-like n=1 Tax=Cordylochernes scorpioides TaxID=51811 RepID=A0ABY6KLA6_9ARAC|nr:K02A2.6-like [Cordylochernes scorpioides]